MFSAPSKLTFDTSPPYMALRPRRQHVTNDTNVIVFFSRRVILTAPHRQLPQLISVLRGMMIFPVPFKGAYGSLFRLQVECFDAGQ